MSYHIATPGHRGDRLEIKSHGKRIYIWHLIFLGERSSSRSHHLVLWSLGTLIGQHRL